MTKDKKLRANSKTRVFSQGMISKPNGNRNMLAWKASDNAYGDELQRLPVPAH
jgi:hypothetical protein